MTMCQPSHHFARYGNRNCEHPYRTTPGQACKPRLGVANTVTKGLEQAQDLLFKMMAPPSSNREGVAIDYGRTATPSRSVWAPQQRAPIRNHHSRVATMLRTFCEGKNDSLGCANLPFYNTGDV